MKYPNKNIKATHFCGTILLPDTVKKLIHHDLFLSSSCYSREYFLLRANFRNYVCEIDSFLERKKMFYGNLNDSTIELCREIFLNEKRESTDKRGGREGGRENQRIKGEKGNLTDKG